MSSNINVQQYWSGVYHTLFPEEWAESHMEGTGPDDCSNCRAYGLIGGEFAGYCINCAQYDYKGSRGRGFWGNGVEFEGTETLQVLGESVYETYLAGVGLPMDMDFENHGEMDLEDHGETDLEDHGDMDLENHGETDLEDHGDSVMMCHYEGGYNDL